MEKLAPTRQNLLGLRVQYAVIKKGLELLKSKREALMKEFFGIVEESVRMRAEFTGLLNKAQRDLEIARALHGPAVESFAHAVKRDVTIDITVENIWGLNVPSIAETALTRTLEARDVSIRGESAMVFGVAREFEVVADFIVKIASKEARLQRVGEMIKADTRKINAIGEIMMPSMRRRVKSIERVLEEREREEVFRLKRYKARRPGRG
ncbi:MAG: V-type ATP synthase subunit D [Deltaproteobacteria bacterium]|nr:V-type ATP synthase subunit D [Deltaproteobacteria bacterium]